MNRQKSILFAVVLVFLLPFCSSVTLGAPVGTAFTYSGSLSDSAQPAQGSYDLAFTLYDSSLDRIVARPIIVERLLRERVENDAELHAIRRREAERTRRALLAVKQAAVEFSNEGCSQVQSSQAEIANRKWRIEGRLLRSSPCRGLVEQLVALLRQGHSNEVSQTTWQLVPPRETTPDSAHFDPVELRPRFGPDAEFLSSSHGRDQESRLYFRDLPSELRRVLRAQLRQAGDVSAVVEMPHAFLVYVCTEKTAGTLSVATLALPKRSYEQWLTEPDGSPE